MCYKVGFRKFFNSLIFNELQSYFYCIVVSYRVLMSYMNAMGHKQKKSA
jgi:hypothetical protein